jgi:DNA-binding NarL/FixJ family response regulator
MDLTKAESWYDLVDQAVAMNQRIRSGRPASAPRAGPLIRIAIIEDQPEIRDGLTSLINATDGYRCTASFPSMEDALPRIGRELPDVALIDIGLPGMSGIEGTRLLKERYPNLLLLILTIYDDDDRIFDALCAGACGYLLKKTPSARLLESLGEAMTGGAPMSPEVARRVVGLFQRFRPPHHGDYHLTPHEVRLLKMLVQGHNYTSAASELGVSFSTIAFHMQSIYQKLQVHSKSEAVARALLERLV